MPALKPNEKKWVIQATNNLYAVVYDWRHCGRIDDHQCRMCILGIQIIEAVLVPDYVVVGLEESVLAARGMIEVMSGGEVGRS